MEEVNRTLKQTNDELSEELGELRQKLDIVTAEVCVCVYVCYSRCCMYVCLCVLQLVLCVCVCCMCA